MIKKRIKNITKLTGLILVRQGWKLGGNLYHLINEPFLTIKKIIREKDKSQIFLLTLVFLMPIITYIGARVVWDYYRYGLILKSVGNVFILVMFIQILIWSYLIFWLVRVIKKRHD